MGAATCAPAHGRCSRCSQHPSTCLTPPPPLPQASLRDTEFSGAGTTNSFGDEQLQVRATPGTGAQQPDLPRRRRRRARPQKTALAVLGVSAWQRCLPAAAAAAAAAMQAANDTTTISPSSAAGSRGWQQLATPVPAAAAAAPPNHRTRHPPTPCTPCEHGLLRARQQGQRRPPACQSRQGAMGCAQGTPAPPAWACRPTCTLTT
jgi:hypothetical protein